MLGGLLAAASRARRRGRLRRSDEQSSSDGGSSAAAGSSGGVRSTGLAKSKRRQKNGGTLNVVSAEGWEHLDPGASYFQIDYLVVFATQRPLYIFTPKSPTTPVPDLAAGAAEDQRRRQDGDVKIKPGRQVVSRR